MSALGQKPTWRSWPGCLLYPQERHQSRPTGCPLSANSGHQRLFDHAPGHREQDRWDFDPKHLGRLEINDEFEFGWLLYRQLRRLRPLDYFADEDGCRAEDFLVARTVRHQPTRIDET